MNGTERYREEAGKFEKTDLLLAVAFYAVWFLSFWVMGKVFYLCRIINEDVVFYTVQFIPVYLLLGTVVLICRLRKQSIREILYAKEEFGRSCAMGAIVSCVIVAGAFLLSRGNVHYGLFKAVERFFYYLVIVAFPEEFVFRGYMGKRFYGAIPNRFAAVAAVAVLCAVQHIPFQAAVRGMTLAQYCAANWRMLIPLAVFHVIFHCMTVEYNNIAMPVAVHCAWDFVQDLFDF